MSEQPEMGGMPPSAAHRREAAEADLAEARAAEARAERDAAQHEAQERERREAVLRDALNEALDIIVWMSGSPSFSSGGDAHGGWVKARDKLDGLFRLAERGERKDVKTPGAQA